MNWSISITFPPPAPAILSPCIGVCTLDSDGRCEGCLRSGEEIARWSAMSDGERQYLMDVVLPQREAMRDQGPA